MADRRVFTSLHDALQNRMSAVLFTVIESPKSELLGAKALLVQGEGGISTSASTLPDDWMDHIAAIASERLDPRGKLGAQSAESYKRPKRVTIEPMPLVPGVSLSVEVFHPRPRLVIAGGGHIAVPTHEIADIVGFAVTVLDDRPAFADPERFPRAERVICDDFTSGISHLEIDSRTSVVVVTRGHLHDLEVIRALANTDPAYVGMIGSRRRTLTVVERLEEEGFSDEFVGRIYSPIGLDIGAETPEEIALAIVSEVVCVLRGGSGTHLRRSLRRFRLE